MSPRIPLIATALALVLAAPASAKGIDSVSICGADGCTDVTDRASHTVLETGPLRAAPREPEPYFVVRVRVMHPEEGATDALDSRWLPKAGLQRTPDGQWVGVLPRTQRELLRLSKGLEPHPVPASAKEEEEGGGPSTALVVAAPAVLLLGLGGLATRRRRRRQG